MAAKMPPSLTAQHWLEQKPCQRFKLFLYKTDPVIHNQLQPYTTCSKNWGSRLLFYLSSEIAVREWLVSEL
ncbi:MAG: hypothetical protein HYU70_10310 [Bacteroidetes bacterium]|nr:hypothetical protein [Bacteroidota bacterium]